MDNSILEDLKEKREEAISTYRATETRIQEIEEESTQLRAQIGIMVGRIQTLDEVIGLNEQPEKPVNNKNVGKKGRKKA